MDVLNKFKQFNRLIVNTNSAKLAEDNYCLGIINKVLHTGSYLPLSAMSLRPFVLAFLMNEIVINSRKNIIEFGSGVSTILLARLIKMNNLSAKLISVDENQSWIELIKSILDQEGLLEYVDLVHSPVAKKGLDGMEGNHWYNSELVNDKIAGHANFDMVIIDGPTAYNKEIEMSRYFAVPFIKERLAAQYVIFIDDANRDGEQKVISRWKNEFNLDFKIYAETVAVSYSGDHFESKPMQFISTVG